MMRSRLIALLTLACLSTGHFNGQVLGKEAENAKSAAPSSAAKPAASEKEEAKQPNKVRLAHIVIRGALPESPGQMSLFGDLGTDLRKTVARIDKAANDKSIAGVILEIETLPGRGKLHELRAAIKRLQSSGKKVYAQLETAMGPQYQLAAACDEIVLPESGIVFAPGVRMEVGFFKNMFDKLGLKADMMHVGDSKGAGETFTRTDLSEPVRKNLSALVDDLYDQLIATLAADRQLPVDEVKAAVDRGLLTAADAKEAGLVDRVAYPDEFRAQLAKEYKADRLVYVVNYAKRKVDTDFSGPMGMMKLFQAILGGSSKSGDRGPKVAIVYAVGPIFSGKSQTDPFGGQAMGSTTIVKALNEAADDDSVKAIVLRVNSPGGSALASDLIWRATQRIEKPIIASMGDVAASGGYYISMGADRILAEPATVTGSIGVVGGKIDMGGLYEKIGMTTEAIARGANSGLFSATDSFTDEQREVVMHMMNTIYDQFTSKAAAGRGMQLDKLQELAGGKVYTGRVAKRIGLVDDLGTLKDAVRQAKTMAGLGADEDVGIKVLPKPQNPFEALLGADLDAQREARFAAGAFVGLTPELTPAVRRVWQLKQLLQSPTALISPYYFEIK